MIYVLFLILFSLSQLVIGDYFDPTSTESERYLAVHPTEEWGEQLREEGSIRLMVIGGSNSKGTGCSVSFVDIVFNFIGSNNGSYLINQSLGGSDISDFLGETYEFESWPTTRWPNVILIESAINSAGSWITAQNIDNLLFLLFEKFASKKIPKPDVFFLELFNVGWITMPFEGSDRKEKRIQHLSSFDSRPEMDEKFNHGCRAGVYINALARFYSYPMVTAIDTLFPAFTRFFIENKLVSSYGDLEGKERNVWPYTFDGVHLSCKGHAYVGNNLLIRFLQEQMKPKVKSIQPHDGNYTKYDIRMFSPSTYTTLLSKWSTWGEDRSDLSAIIEPTIGWNHTYLDNGRHVPHDGHDCYGSRITTTQKAIFKIETPRICKECKLGVSYLHSWNTSYIGSVSCSLFTVLSSRNNNIRRISTIANETIVIDGSRHGDQEVTATVPRETKFLTSLKRGRYRVECSKLDSKFACFAKIAIYLN